KKARQPSRVARRSRPLIFCVRYMSSQEAEGSSEKASGEPVAVVATGLGPQDNAVIRFLMFAAVVGCAYLARSFVLMLVASGVAAMALSPIVRGARRIGIPRLAG